MQRVDLAYTIAAADAEVLYGRHTVFPPLMGGGQGGVEIVASWTATRFCLTEAGREVRVRLLGISRTNGDQSAITVVLGMDDQRVQGVGRGRPEQPERPEQLAAFATIHALDQLIGARGQFRLENLERAYAASLEGGALDDVIAFAKGRALERLRAFDLAATSYRVAAARPGELAKEAERSAAVCDALFEARTLAELEKDREQLRTRL